MGLIGDGLELIKLANTGFNADVHEKLGKFVEKAQQLQAKVEALESDNRSLRDQIRFNGTLKRDRGITFVEGDREPVCPRCAEVDHRPVHIVSRFGAYPFCPQCKTEYSSASISKRVNGNTE